jgi:hypothetical protein
MFSWLLPSNSQKHYAEENHINIQRSIIAFAAPMIVHILCLFKKAIWAAMPYYFL